MEKVGISFFDEQGEYAARYWAHVPRVGDEIMLMAGKRYVGDRAGKAAFIVKRVVWGVEGPDGRPQCVNIEIVPAPGTELAALTQSVPAIEAREVE